MEKGNQLNIDCADFGTFVTVSSAHFKQYIEGNPYQFLGAVVEQCGRLTCRFLSTHSSAYFTGEPGDVQEWIDNGWMTEAITSDREDAIHLSLLE